MNSRSNLRGRSVAPQLEKTNRLLRRVVRLTVGAGGFLFLEDAAEPSDERWHEADADDGENDEFEVFLHHGVVSKKETCAAAHDHPDEGADDSENHEAGVIHFTHASDEWSERADERDEPGQHDGLGAVFVVEELRFG